MPASLRSGEAAENNVGQGGKQRNTPEQTPLLPPHPMLVWGKVAGCDNVLPPLYSVGMRAVKFSERASDRWTFNSAINAFG